MILTLASSTSVFDRTGYLLVNTIDGWLSYSTVAIGAQNTFSSSSNTLASSSMVPSQQVTKYLITLL